MKWLGAIACADELRRTTDGKTVRELKSALPGIYPDVFGFTMYFKGMDVPRKDAETPSGVDGIIFIGVSLLMSILADLPRSLVSRLTFKFPKKFCAAAPLRLKRETGAMAVSRLLKLKFPEAYKLCC